MKTRTAIAYCFTAMFLFGISCASGDGSGCGSVKPVEDPNEAQIKRHCMASTCIHGVVSCFNQRMPEPYRNARQTTPEHNDMCQWLFGSDMGALGMSVSEGSPGPFLVEDGMYWKHSCHSKCGSCSQGEHGDLRMARMVQVLMGCHR